jgi:hypothetical protein
VKLKTLYTCCEQVGRRGKDYDFAKPQSLPPVMTGRASHKRTSVFYIIIEMHDEK